MASQAFKQEENVKGSTHFFPIIQEVASTLWRGSIWRIVDRSKYYNVDDNQLVVDLLSTALEDNLNILENPNYVLLLLTKLSSSANVFARNRTISSNHIVHSRLDFPDVYTLRGNTPVQVRVVKRGKENSAEVFNEDLITWAHLSHASILPIYAAFLDGTDGPVSLVSLHTTRGHVVEYATTLSQTARIPLISDAIEGLGYLHHLNVVHGRLSPQYLSISDDGRALIICPSISSEMQDFELRYSAPELLKEEEEDPRPTQGADIWSLGCIIYEVLSGKVPFWQIRHERRVLLAVLNGARPARPAHESMEISDPVWHSILPCWEFSPEDRPTYFELWRAFTICFSMRVIQGDRPIPIKQLQPEAFDHSHNSTFDIDHARSILTRMIDHELPMPCPPHILKRAQPLLVELADVLAKSETARLSLTVDFNVLQNLTLIEILDMIVKENPVHLDPQAPMMKLLKKTMRSTRTIPHWYQIDSISYNPTPIATAGFGKVYKGRDLEAYVTVIVNQSYVLEILDCLAVWAHALHPNILPFYGVFYDNLNEDPQFCLVSPYMEKGFLNDYAPSLSQQDRLPLIFDVINGLVYLQGLNIIHDELRADRILISDGGRAVLTWPGTGEIFPAVPVDMRGLRTSTHTLAYELHFLAPEGRVHGASSHAATVWSFGCLLYEVLSRKLPYHQYTSTTDVLSALSRGEPPKRPTVTDDMDEIGDQFWDLIIGCCVHEPEDRLALSQIQKSLGDMVPHDLPNATASMPSTETFGRKPPAGINLDVVIRVLDEIQVRLLQGALSKLVQNRTINDLAAAVAQFDLEDTRTLVDFFDQAIEAHMIDSDESNRVLVLLAMITKSTSIFPQRYELKNLKYHPSPISGGGIGTVHQGVFDPTLCFKVIPTGDTTTMMTSIKGLTIWAHVHHPNVHHFNGVFVDDSENICLVSPFMGRGNLHDYAQSHSQKERGHLLYDVINGITYLHSQGIVHGNIKGTNILVSDEGRGLITDFGASDIFTATTGKEGIAIPASITLRFAAPEIILSPDSGPRPEHDIWAFGCLCFEIFSRKLPYFQYCLEAQIFAALSLGQPPIRPGSAIHSDQNPNLYEPDMSDWDMVDDPTWNLITNCCAPKPEGRPKPWQIQSNMEVYRQMPGAQSGSRSTPRPNLPKLRTCPIRNLERVGPLLENLAVRNLAQSKSRNSAEDNSWMQGTSTIAAKHPVSTDLVPQRRFPSPLAQPFSRRKVEKSKPMMREDSLKEDSDQQATEPVTRDATAVQDKKRLKQKGRATISTGRRPKIATDSHLQLSDSQIYDLCLSSITHALVDDAIGGRVIELKGNKAQCIVNFLSEVLDRPESFSPHDKEPRLRLLSKLVNSAQVFPSSYELGKIQYHFNEPRKYRGSVIIYRANYGDEVVSVKAIKVPNEITGRNRIKTRSGALVRWAHISHPNVLPFLGIYLTKETVCLVTPWMQNADLPHYLTNFPETRRIPLVHDILLGLKYLHDNEILHGDLRATNVLVSATNRAMLTGFEVSRSVTAAMTGLPETSIQSSHWTAPELLSAFSRPNYQGDIWSFACTCYEIITGLKPFYQFEKIWDLRSAFLKGNLLPLKPPEVERDETKEEIWSVAERVWKSDLESRPTAGELLTVVDKLYTSDDRTQEPEYRRTNEVTVDYRMVLRILSEIQAPSFDGSLSYTTMLHTLFGEKNTISYLLDRRGPEHMPTWTSQCKFEGDIKGVGNGATKHAAKEEAAKMALQSMGLFL